MSGNRVAKTSLVRCSFFLAEGGLQSEGGLQFFLAEGGLQSEGGLQFSAVVGFSCSGSTVRRR